MDKEKSIKLTENAREIGKMLHGLSKALLTT